MDTGYDIHFLLDLDILSFGDLSEIAMELRNLRSIDQAISIKAALSDGKAWTEYVNHLTPGKPNDPEPNDSEAFQNLVKFGGLK